MVKPNKPKETNQKSAGGFSLVPPLLRCNPYLSPLIGMESIEKVMCYNIAYVCIPPRERWNERKKKIYSKGFFLFLNRLHNKSVRSQKVEEKF